MPRTRVLPVLLAGAGGLAASLALIGSGSAAPAAPVAATPVLGSTHLARGGQGFGAVKPPTVFLGGDPTGLLQNVTWHAWGTSKATGDGTGYYPPPGKPVAAAVRVPVVLRASSLGPCKGRLAYRHLTITFEYKGHAKSGVALGI